MVLPVPEEPTTRVSACAGISQVEVAENRRGAEGEGDVAEGAPVVQRRRARAEAGLARLLRFFGHVPDRPVGALRGDRFLVLGLQLADAC